MQATSWLVMVLSVLGLVVALVTYVFCFIFALTKRHLSSRASNYALAGVVCFVIASLLSRTLPIVFTQFFGMSQMATALTALGLLNSILSCIGIVLLLIGVFVDRRPESPSEFLPGDSQAATSDRNPYVASPVDPK